MRILRLLCACGAKDAADVAPPAEGQQQTAPHRDSVPEATVVGDETGASRAFKAAVPPDNLPVGWVGLGVVGDQQQVAQELHTSVTFNVPNASLRIGPISPDIELGSPSRAYSLLPGSSASRLPAASFPSPVPVATFIDLPAPFVPEHGGCSPVPLSPPKAAAPANGDLVPQHDDRAVPGPTTDLSPESPSTYPTPSSSLQHLPPLHPAASSPPHNLPFSGHPTLHLHRPQIHQSFRPSLTNLTPSNGTDTPASAAGAAPSTSNTFTLSANGILVELPASGAAATTTTSLQAPGHANRLVGPPPTLHIPGDSGNHGPVPHTGWSVGAIHSGQQSSVLAVGTPHISNFGYVSDRPGSMHMLAALCSGRTSGVVSPRMSSFQYQYPFPPLPPSPPRSSPNALPSRVSMSGAGSVLSLPIETSSLYDFTAPNTGLVAEHTALEMGSLAPALDLWAAGAHVSPQAKIAQGAYGVVYRGLWHGCTCAVKLMLAASTENLSLQLTEVFVCKALSCHPNIVQTFDCNVWRITADTLAAVQQLLGAMPGGMNNPLDGPSSSGLGPGGPGVAAGASSSFLAFHNSGLNGGAGGSVVMPSAAYSMGRGSATSLAAQPSGTWAGAHGDMGGVGAAASASASVGAVMGGMGGGGGYFNSGEQLRRASIHGRASTDRQDACAPCITRALTSTSTSSSVQGSQHDVRHRSMGVGGLEPWVVAGSGSGAGSGGGTGMGRRELPRSGSGWMPQMAWEGAGSAAGMGSAGVAAGMGPGAGGSAKGSGGMWSGSMGAPPLAPGTPQVLINVSCSGCSSLQEGSCGPGQVAPSGAQQVPLLALPSHAKTSSVSHPYPHPCPAAGHPGTGLSRQRSWQREPHGSAALVSPLGPGPKSSPSLVPPRYLNPVSEERVSAIAAVTSGSMGSLLLTSPGAAASLLGVDVGRLGSGLTTSSSRGRDHGGFSGPTRDPEQMVLSGSNREQEQDGEQDREQGRARRFRQTAPWESEAPRSAGGTPASAFSGVGRGAAASEAEAEAAAGNASGSARGGGVAVGISAAMVHHQHLTDLQQHHLNISRQLSSHVGSVHGPDTSREFMLVSLSHTPPLGAGLGTGGGAGVGVGLNTAAGAAGVFSDGGDSEQRTRSKDCSVIGYITANNLFLPHSSMQEISPIKSNSRFGAPRGLGSDLRLSTSGGMAGRSGSAGGADSSGSNAGGGGAVASVVKVTASRTRSAGGVLGDGPRTSASGVIDFRASLPPLPVPPPVQNQPQLHHAPSGPDLHAAAVSDTSSPGTPTGRQLARGRGAVPFNTPVGLYGSISHGGPAWPGTAPGSGSATAAAQQQLQILMYQQQQQQLQQLQQQPRGAFDSPDRSRLTSPRYVHPPAGYNPSPFLRSLSRGQVHGPGLMQASGQGPSMAPLGTASHGSAPHAYHGAAPGMGAGAGPPGSASAAVTLSPAGPTPLPASHMLYSNVYGGPGVSNGLLSRPASQVTGREISPVNSGLLPRLPPLPQQLSSRRPSGAAGLGGGFGGLGGGGGSAGLLGSRFPSERASAGTAAMGSSATAAAAVAGVAASILSTGDHAEHLAAEAGARNLAQVLHALGAREGQLAVLVVMEECDRGSLQNLLNKAAVATAAAAAARQQQQQQQQPSPPQQQQHGPGVATPPPADTGNSPFSAASISQLPPTPDLYAPFSLGGRYSTHAALKALVATAKEVALGMSFLHKNNIVHGDLKPGNVLLKSSRADQRGFVAKLSDFGLSRVLHTAATSRAMHGPHASHASHASQRGAMRTLSMASGTGGMTPLGPRSGRQAPGDSYGPGDGFASGGGVEDSGLLYGGAVYGGLMYGGAGSAASAGLGAGGWQAGDGEPKLVGALDGTVPFLAPELIEEGQRSKASDVWAYGVLLWYLVTGKRPYEGLMHVQIMAAVVNGEQLLKWPHDAHPALQSLGHGCLAFEPHRRLTFAQIVRRLQGLELELRGEVPVGPSSNMA